MIRGTPLLAMLLLSACATNALRVEYAGKVAEQGQAAAIASRQFLDKVEATRREADIALVVADPACGRIPAHLRATPRIDAPPNTPGSLCLAPGEPVTDDDSRIWLRPLTDDLRPTIALIEALTDYADALTQIVEAEPSDPAQQLRDAFATAKAAQDLFTAVLDKPAGPIPGPDDPRVGAVAAFVGFLGELADEKKQVEDLRRLIKDNPDTTAAVIMALRDQLKLWDNGRKGDEALRTGLVAAKLRRVLDASPPASPGERGDAMQAFNARTDAANAAALLYPALDRLLATVAASDRDLRRILVENPDLNPRERARIAEINRQRLVRALNAVTTIINAFRGG